MKGNRMFPQCGFSNTAVQVLGALGVEYETFDILEDAFVRQEGECDSRASERLSVWLVESELRTDGEQTISRSLPPELRTHGSGPSSNS